MDPPSISLPRRGEIVPSIRSSCKEARIAANIGINEKAIELMLRSPLFNSTFQKLSLAHGVVMPLQFPSTLAEVNLISILSLLNFGHSYRVPLKKATGRGAYDSIRALIFGLYLSSSEGDDLMSAQGMKSISNARIAELMQLTNYIHIEQSHPTIPGLTIGQLGGPLYELVGLITSVLNETGNILVNREYSNLGAFVLDALKKGERGNGEPVNPEVVLDEILGAFPAFRDVGSYEGKPIYVFKKALFLLHALVLRFGKGQKIPLPDTSNLPIFSDNVIPSMLVHFGVLELTDTNLLNLRTAFGRLTVTENLELVAATRNDAGNRSSADLIEGPKLSKDEAYVLRAAAIDACEKIVQTARDLAVQDPQIQSVTLPELDGWLWSVAKEGRLRSDLVRFCESEVPCVMY